MQQRLIIGYCVSARMGRSGEKSAIRGSRKNREAPDEGAFILEKERAGKMKIVEIDINKIKPYEKNPRKNDDAVKYVKASIEEFGFKIPLVVDKNNTIVAGHTRYKAAMQIGMKKIPCIVADDLTEEQIKAFRIVDNKTSEFSSWDFPELENQLEDIISIDMKSFGFEEIESIDMSDFFTEKDEIKEKKQNVIVCPNCGKQIEL